MKLKYKKAQASIRTDTCLSLFGTNHPVSVCNIPKLWNGGAGLRGRFLWDVADDDILTLGACYDLRLNDPGPPFDLMSTVSALYAFVSTLLEMIELHPSTEARTLLFRLSADPKERRLQQRGHLERFKEHTTLEKQATKQ